MRVGICALLLMAGCTGAVVDDDAGALLHDAGVDDGRACAEYDGDTCPSPRCGAWPSRPMTDAGCYDDNMVVWCSEAVLGTGAETHGVDDEGRCWWFSGGWQPGGFTPADGPQCDAPRCSDVDDGGVAGD